MTQPAPKSATGTITADPNPVPADSNSVTVLSWKSNTDAAEVYVREEGAPEKLFSSKANGSLEVGWIQPCKSYVFYLYDSTPPRRVIDEVAVSKNVGGKLTVDSGTDEQGKVAVHWEITSPLVGEVCLVGQGEEEKLVSRGTGGSVEVAGLGAGVSYLFRLYAATKARPLLDEKSYYREVIGKITAYPNPIPLDAGSKTLLKWTITAPSIAEVRISENGTDEKLVTRGASGSFEISGLRAGIEYLVRLYNKAGDRQLLDEVKVRLADIPLMSLLERLRSGRGGSDYSTELANFLAAVLPGCLHHRDFGEWFRLWEANGVHVTPVHFYEPIPDSRSLSEKLWEKPQALPGVEMNDTTQRHLLCDIFPKFKKEYDQIPSDPTEGKNSFYLKNGRFEALDPLLAYCMVRHYKPRQIIEVGSGFSTLVLAQAACVNGTTELHSIEPYPEEFLTQGFPGLTSLLIEKVEEVDLAFFNRLESGDFLFIDTSHVIKIGGDVNFLFLEVLPRLKPGVFVHVHDIFFPLEYPKDWVIQRRRSWTEQYLLQAFLAFNSEFEVLVSSGYLKFNLPEELKVVFPTGAPWSGGSFWMRRKPKAS